MDPYKVAMSKLVLAISQLEAVSSNIVALINLDSSITSLPDPPDSEIKLVFKDGVAVLDETVSYLYEVNSFFSKLETAKNDSGLTADPMEQILADPVRQMRLETTVRTEPKEVKTDEINTKALLVPVFSDESNIMDVSELFDYIKNNDINLCATDNYKEIKIDGEKNYLTEKFKNSIKIRKQYIIKRLVLDETISLIMAYPDEIQSYWAINRNDRYRDYKIFDSCSNITAANFHVLKKLLQGVVTSCSTASTTGEILEQFRNTDIFEILLDKSQVKLMIDWWGENNEDYVGRFSSNLDFLEKNCILKQIKTISENNNIETYKKTRSKNIFAASKIKKHYKYLSKYFIYSKLNNKNCDDDFLKCIHKIGRRIYVNKELFDKWLMSHNHTGKKNGS